MSRKRARKGEREDSGVDPGSAIQLYDEVRSPAKNSLCIPEFPTWRFPHSGRSATKGTLNNAYLMERDADVPFTLRFQSDSPQGSEM